MKRQEIRLYKVFVSDCKEPISIENMKNCAKFGFMIDKNVSIAEALEIQKAVKEYSLENKELTKTLFTRSELKSLDLFDKVCRQLTLYFLDGQYGKQFIDLGDDTISFDIIKVIPKEELQKLIEDDIYVSKPLSAEKVRGIVELIKQYNFNIDYKQIKNREVLASYVADNCETKLQGISGDDVLRAIVYVAQDRENALLIKSPEVIGSIIFTIDDAKDRQIIKSLLETYTREVAEVFHRQKKLLLAIKEQEDFKDLKNIINRISKLAKKVHKPFVTPKYQTFINEMETKTQSLETIKEAVSNLTVIEKFKILNVMAIRKLNLPTQTFMIRNGKVWTKDNSYKGFGHTLGLAEYVILESLHDDFKHLKSKRIKMPKYIEYGLPISEKMSCGNIPFGSIVHKKDEFLMLTVGMYWRNEWGARDLDLSSIDLEGCRVGWGQISSYTDGVIFSGDLVDAKDGAIECIGNPLSTPVILVNNIFNGESGTRFKVVVGEFEAEEVQDNDIYLEDTLYNFDYKFQGNKRSCVLGALYKDKFILYPANVGSCRISGGRDNNMLRYITAPRFTMNKLLSEVIGADIVYEGDCDIDLSLETVTFKDLQELFTQKVLNLTSNNY